MPFSFPFSILKLYFIFLNRLVFDIVTSVYPTGTRGFYLSFFSNAFIQQVPKQTKQMILNGALKKCKVLHEQLASNGDIMVYLVGSQI